MKELSIEQKAKAYNEAIEKGKQIQNYPYTAHWDIMKEVVEHLFPELKDDEKIRKALIKYYSFDKDGGSHALDNITPEQIVAYLEKQGQKGYTFKPLPRLLDMIEPTSGAKAYCQKLMNTLVKEGYSIDAKIVGECLKKMNGEDVPMAIMDEKQGKNAYNKELSELLHKVICRFINAPDIPYSDREKVSMKVLPYVERLEKQSEPIEVNPTEFDLHLNRLLKQFESLSKEELASSLSFYLNVVQNDGTYKNAEKQCGQKPFDYENANIQQKDFAPKVEQMPDLERGKWYVCDTPRYTDFVVGKAYLCPKNGMLRPNENEMARYVARSCFHIWTIQDAKDGDVLAFDDETIVIFKDLYNATTFHSYCHIEDGIFDFNKEGIPDWWEGKGFHPATIEERDLLFQKMTESGYKWDANKLELKRIDIQELVKQTPAWSEEDEQKFSDILALLRGGENCHYNTPDLFDWLKSLKARVGNFDDGYKVGFSAAKHNQWKPSDVQMRILSIYADQNNSHGTVLTSLHNDLKKLKG